MEQINIITNLLLCVVTLFYHQVIMRYTNFVLLTYLLTLPHRVACTYSLMSRNAVGPMRIYCHLLIRKHKEKFLRRKFLLWQIILLYKVRPIQDQRLRFHYKTRQYRSINQSV